MQDTNESDTLIEMGVEPQISEKRPTTTVNPTAYLDGLRGVAAFIVYIYHSIAIWYMPDMSYERGYGWHGKHTFITLPFIRTLFTGGPAAVALFFVMSGYVLSVSTLKMQVPAAEVRKTLLIATLRRPFRLFLPVAGLSLMYVAALQLPFGLGIQVRFPKAEPSLLAELRRWAREFMSIANIFTEHTTDTHWFPYSPAVWTMPAELKGSIMIFALLAATAGMKKSIRRTYIFATVGVTMLILSQWEFAGFILGSTIAMLDAEKAKKTMFMSQTRFEAVAYNAILILGWYLLGQPMGRNIERASATPGWHFLAQMTPHNLRDAGHYTRFWPMIGAALFLYALTNVEWAKRMFARPTCRWLGKISFSLYLAHAPILWTFGDRAGRVLGRRWQEYDTVFDNLMPIPDIGPMAFSTRFLVWVAVTLPVNLYFAAWATKHIDEPSARFAKWLGSQLSMQRPAQRTVQRSVQRTTLDV